MTTVYSPLQYGGGLYYYATIEGIPTIFSEGIGSAASGKTLPADYSTEDASLVVDASAPIGSRIDRNKGIGVGFPFDLRLRDTAHVRGWFQRWTNAARLTADATVSAAVLTVKDTTGWGAAGSFYLGAERVTYTGKTATTFTGCARGVVGYPYAHSKSGVTSYATDKPRWWRGREVQLWAAPRDSLGNLPDAAALAAHAELVWRGHIERGPRLEADGLWTLGALSIDRRLARKLSSSLSGEVVDTAARFEAPSGGMIWIRIQAWGGGASKFLYYFWFTPFPVDTYPAGTWISGSEARQQVATAFAAKVSAEGAGGDILGMVWGKTYGAGQVPKDHYVAQIKYTANGAVDMVSYSTKIFGVDLPQKFTQHVGGFGAGALSYCGWFTGDLITHPNETFGQPNNSRITVELDSGSPAAVTAPGLIKIGDVVHRFGLAQASSGLLFLAGVRVLTDDSFSTEEFTGMSAEVLQVFEGTAPNVVRTILESSSTGDRGTYDTEEIGYAIDASAVDETGIGSRLGSGYLKKSQLTADFADRSLVDIIGGLLALTGRALVARQTPGVTGRPVRITAVHTVPSGTGWTAEIVDADLLVDGSTPAVVTKPISDPVNVIEVIGSQGGEETFKFTARDAGAVQAQGVHRQRFSVPLADRETIVPVVLAWSKARFASDQVVQAVELRIPPWIEADVGDVIKLTSAHFALWTFSSGLPGYTGLARVIGRSFMPKTYEVTLTVLIDGLSLGGGLCPAAVIVGTDHATAPSYIDVPAQFRLHYQTTITEAGGTATVRFFEPGTAETTADGYVINAAAISGGNCRLTVDSVIGTPTIVINEVYITIPETGTASTYQAEFSHADDGSFYQ